MVAKTTFGKFAAYSRKQNTVPAHFVRKRLPIEPNLTLPESEQDMQSSTKTAPPSPSSGAAIGRQVLFHNEPIGLPMPDDLKKASSSSVVTDWTGVRAAVNQSGMISITNHKRTEYVLMGVEQYLDLREMTRRTSPHQVSLDELNAEFDAQIASFQTPAFDRAIDKMLEADGEFPEATYIGPTR